METSKISSLLLFFLMFQQTYQIVNVPGNHRNHPKDPRAPWFGKISTSARPIRITARPSTSSYPIYHYTKQPAIPSSYPIYSSTKKPATPSNNHIFCHHKQPTKPSGNPIHYYNKKPATPTSYPIHYYNKQPATPTHYPVHYYNKQPATYSSYPINNYYKQPAPPSSYPINYYNKNPATSSSYPIYYYTKKPFTTTIAPSAPSFTLVFSTDKCDYKCDTNKICYSKYTKYTGPGIKYGYCLPGEKCFDIPSECQDCNQVVNCETLQLVTSTTATTTISTTTTSVPEFTMLVNTSQCDYKCRTDNVCFFIFIW